MLLDTYTTILQKKIVGWLVHTTIYFRRKWWAGGYPQSQSNMKACSRQIQHLIRKQQRQQQKIQASEQLTLVRSSLLTVPAVSEEEVLDELEEEVLVSSPQLSDCPPQMPDGPPSDLLDVLPQLADGPPSELPDDSVLPEDAMSLSVPFGFTMYHLGGGRGGSFDN